MLLKKPWFPTASGLGVRMLNCIKGSLEMSTMPGRVGLHLVFWPGKEDLGKNFTWKGLLIFRGAQRWISHLLKSIFLMGQGPAYQLTPCSPDQSILLQCCLTCNMEVIIFQRSVWKKYQAQCNYGVINNVVIIHFDWFINKIYGSLHEHWQKRWKYFKGDNITSSHLRQLCCRDSDSFS